MRDGIEIRISRTSDMGALEDLYRFAFPDEDLLPLIRELLSEKDGVFSFVAMRDGVLAGHIVFTMCRVDGRSETVSLLGPLAVSPQCQRQGIGGALVREGLKRVTGEGAASVFVLGAPNYYGRFGFEADAKVEPPYALPEAWRTAWQSLGLCDAKHDLAGTLAVPEPWAQPALWAP